MQHTYSQFFKFVPAGKYLGKVKFMYIQYYISQRVTVYKFKEK